MWGVAQSYKFTWNSFGSQSDKRFFIIDIVFFFFYKDTFYYYFEVSQLLRLLSHNKLSSFLRFDIYVWRI